jgi:hypothetical protein
MVELRHSRPAAAQHTIAVLDLSSTRDAVQNHPALPAYVEGCRQRGAALGYGLDWFWLREPGCCRSVSRKAIEGQFVQEGRPHAVRFSLRICRGSLQSV